jgi:type IV pilus assembly protein PilB
LRTIDSYIYSIFSIADIGGRDIFGVTQFEVRPEDDLDTTLMRMIRSEADVVFLDPLRDAETAKVVFGKQDRTTLLSEMTAKDAAQAVLQLIAWLEDPKKVAEGLRAIISQKLIRRLCDKCKEAYRPNPKLIVKVGLPPETKTLYRPPVPKPPTPDQPQEEIEPCRKCGGIGYFGRMAMFEMVEMTDAMRELVATGPKNPADIRALARKEKMLTFQRDGLRLVTEGKTSLEELQRVFKA